MAPEREVVHPVDHPAIDVEEAVGLDDSLGIVHRGHDDPRRHQRIRRQDLPPVRPAVQVIQPDRLEPGSRAEVPPLPCHHFKELLQRFQTQRSGNHRILIEMRREEPRRGINLKRPPDVPQALRTTIEDQFLDPVDHPPAVVGKRRRGRVIAPGRPAQLGGGRFIEHRVADADLVAQGRLREEAERRFHPVHRTATRCHLDVVALNNHPARLRHLGRRHLGPERSRVAVDRLKLRGRPAEVAEREVDDAGQGRPHVRRQPAARLERGFKQDGERHILLAVGSKVPGVGRDVVLGDRLRSRGHHPRVARGLDHPVEELIRRPRQSGDDSVVIEDSIRGPERFGRLPDGERPDRRGVVERRGGWLDLSGPHPDRRELGLIQALHPERHGGDLNDWLAVGVHQGVDDRVRLGPKPEFLDLDLVRHLRRRGHHLPTALEPAGNARNRVANDLVRLADPTHPHQEDPEGMQAALEHERAGHHLVIDEVAGHEPGHGVDVRLGADQTQSIPPPFRLDRDHAVDQPHHPPRQDRGLIQVQARKAISKRRDQITQAERLDLLIPQGFALHRHERLPVVGPDAGDRPEVERRLDHPLAGGEGLLGEEASDPVAHGHQRFAIHRRLEPEPEQPGVPLAEEAVDGNVVDDHLARSRQRAIERHHGVEQPIDRQPFGLEVDPEEGREEQVGLSRLDRDARRNYAAIQVPRPRMDVMLGDESPPTPSTAVLPRSW